MLISRKVTEVSEISHVNLRAGWKDLTKPITESFQFFFGAGCGPKTIINVGTKKFWFGTVELIENLFFYIRSIRSHIQCLSRQPFVKTDRQAPVMPLSLNNCPFTALFQSSIQVSSTSIEENISIQENLNVAISKIIVISNSKHMAWFPEETSQIVF